MIIAVDFDGTIVDHEYPKIGNERPFAIDALKNLQANGHKIILWSVREGKHLEEAVEFCKSRGLEFYAVNSDYPGGAWKGSAGRKLQVDMYIDDRNLGGLPDWSTIYEMITNHMSYEDLIEKAVRGEGETEIYSGTFRGPSSGGHHHHHHHHHGHHRHRMNPFKWIVAKTRESRARFSR